MTDQQKFIGLKNKIIAQNDKQYGEEVKSRWGEDAWRQSNQRIQKMTQAQFDQAASLEKEFKEVLSQAFALHDPASELAQKSVELHRQWLQFFWPEYSPDAHLGLAQMYVDDQRFHHWFGGDSQIVEFFRNAVKVYVAANLKG